VTNDIFTKEDGEFLTRNEALPAERIRAVQVGALPCAPVLCTRTPIVALAVHLRSPGNALSQARHGSWKDRSLKSVIKELKSSGACSA
jgi:hypothetical protein